MNKRRHREVFRVLEQAKSQNLLPRTTQNRWEKYLDRPSNPGQLGLSRDKLEKLAVAKNFVEIERYEEAFHLFSWIGDATRGELSGDCFKQAAKCAQKIRKLAEAKDMLRRAGISYDQAGLSGQAAECWEAFADHLAQENEEDKEYLDDVRYYKRAAKGYMRSGDEEAAVRAYKKVAECYITAGALEDSSKYLILAGEIDAFLKLTL